MRGSKSVAATFSWVRLTRSRLGTLQLLWKCTQSKVTNKCTQNKTHATRLGISARLTAVTLTELGDVSTIAKTLVETLNDVLKNLDATGSVDSSVVHAGRAQTLAKFFYDWNGHGRGKVLVTSWACRMSWKELCPPRRFCMFVDGQQRWLPA